MGEKGRSKNEKKGRKINKWKWKKEIEARGETQTVHFHEFKRLESLWLLYGMWLKIRYTQKPMFSKTARSRYLQLVQRLLQLPQRFHKLFEEWFGQFRHLSLLRTKYFFPKQSYFLSYKNYYTAKFESLMRIHIILVTQIFYINFEELFWKYR